MLILGSKSIRRKEILEMVNIPFKVIIEDVKEDIKNNNPFEYVMETSNKKALPLVEAYPEDIILCCDTVVYLNNRILEKPHSREEAYLMIKSIQGNKHQVLTGVYIGNKEKFENFNVVTDVYVSKMSDGEINDYINTIEPYDKAGGYAIQGIFAKYIEKINGDYYNVMGLPINIIYQKLKNYK